MGRAPAGIYVFGPFRLDPEERELIRDGQPVALTPKAFDVLLTLVQRHGHLVDKADLFESVWPDTAVEEGNLTQTVFVLRRALRVDPDTPAYIETVPKRGYRFVAAVEEIARNEANTGRAAAGSSSAIRAGRASSRALVAAATLVAVVGASVGWLALWANWKHASDDPARRISIERVTTTGRATLAAVSRDARHVAYVLDQDRKRSLWTRDLQTGSQRQVVAPGADDYWSLAFDPNGAYVYATIWQWQQTDASVIRVPTLGGEIAQVLEGSKGGAVSFSPDGRFFAQIEASDRLGHSRIVVYRMDGSVERTVAVRRNPEGFLASYNTRPAWSPDGQSIASAVIVRRGKTVQNTLVATNVGTGAEVRLTRSRWATIGPLVWLPDGRIIFVAREVPTSPQHVWELSLPDDVARPLTGDPMDYDEVTTTADGSMLVAVRTERSIAICIGPADGRGEYRQVISEVGLPRQAIPFSWTADGRIVYASTAAGPLDLWVADPDGSGRRRLTSDAARDFHPAVSPDGASLVYASDRDGAINLWTIGLDGRGAARVTEDSGTGDVYPQWFPDGSTLVFQRGYAWGQPTRLARVTLGSQPELLTTRMSLRPVVSPDGRRLAFFRMDPQGWRLVVIAVDDGREVAAFALPSSSRSRTIRWTPDGSGLAYIDAPDGIDNIWIQPLEGGTPGRLTRFETGSPIEYFEWSRDGARLAIMRETLTSDVVRINGLN